ncbi:hypothetical protein ACFL0Q_09700 [Thermodesulfobacteriota bacterium]
MMKLTHDHDLSMTRSGARACVKRLFDGIAPPYVVYERCFGLLRDVA